MRRESKIEQNGPYKGNVQEVACDRRAIDTRIRDCGVSRVYRRFNCGLTRLCGLPVRNRRRSAKNDATAATECATDAVAERHRMIVIVGRDWPASVLPGRLRWKKNLTLLSR
jgi:hypothetical protein